MRNKIWILLGVGCGGVVVLVAICVIFAIMTVPKMFEWGKQQIALEQERQQLAANWQPPPDGASMTEFFPEDVNEYQLMSTDTNAAIPVFQFDMEGHHATYEKGNSQIDVFVYRVTELEKEALFGRVDKVYEQQESGMKMKTDMGYRMYFSSSAYDQNHLWWINGWLMVFRTKDSDDCEPFIKTFLKSTSK